MRPNGNIQIAGRRRRKFPAKKCRSSSPFPYLVLSAIIGGRRYFENLQIARRPRRTAIELPTGRTRAVCLLLRLVGQWSADHLNLANRLRIEILDNLHEALPTSLLALRSNSGTGLDGSTRS